MGDDAGEVDRRLDAAVAAADHRDTLALVERAVAMRTIGDALVAILILARDAELTPARAGRQDHGARLQRRAVREPNLVQAALALGRDQLLGALESPDIGVIVLHMLLDLRDQLRRSDEHTSELPSLMRSSYAVFCLQKKTIP